MKIQKFIQYAYLFITIFFLYETYRNWNLDRDRAYMLLFFAVLALFMYFFKKRFMKKFDDKTKQ
jgi:O-antigen ligase